MDLKDYLTNERIRQKYKNQFDLVNYAIKLAENMIITGREPRVKIDSQNRSLQVLAEILQGKDSFDEVVVNAPMPSTQRFSIIEEIDDDEKSMDKQEKTAERKKTRKAAVK